MHLFTHIQRVIFHGGPANIVTDRQKEIDRHLADSEIAKQTGTHITQTGTNYTDRQINTDILMD